MSLSLKTRIAVPGEADAGELLEIKTLVSHPMHSGFRSDATGKIIPRDILTRFECRYDDRLVFAMDLQPAIAANPYLSFYLRAGVSGALEFTWIDQHGERHSETRRLVVRPG